MRIAIFGGRFDPIHHGHMAVAKEVLKVKAADEVWFSVENQHQWRPIVARSADRKKMVELSIEDISLSEASLKDKMKVDMTPVELGGLTETIKVVRKLRQKYPQHEFTFIVGSDQLPTFPKWSHWEVLLQEVHFLIVARKGYPLDLVPPNATVVADPTYEPLEDSATRIRNFLHEKKSIHGLVADSVEKYIEEHKLYK